MILSSLITAGEKAFISLELCRSRPRSQSRNQGQSQRPVSVLVSEKVCGLGLGLGRVGLDYSSGKGSVVYAAELIVVGPCFRSLFEVAQEEAMNYESLKLALLKWYNFTEFEYRRRFRDAKSEGQESPGQFIVRLKNYPAQWVKLAKVKLMVSDQFNSACPKKKEVSLLFAK